jgi:hypothetical protein
MTASATAVAYVGGFLTAGYLVVALFFLRFWRQSGETLFAAFSAAFVLLAATQALPTLLESSTEIAQHMYLLRLAAFSLIIAAILIKNIKRS